MSEQLIPPPPGRSQGPGNGQPGTAPADPEWWRILFARGVPGSGTRIGWIFRDHGELVPPFPEPRPDPQSVHDATAARAAAAEKKLKTAWNWIARPSIGLALILVLLSACSASVHDSAVNPVVTVIAIVVLCGPGLAYTGWCWLERDKARDLPPEQAQREAFDDWNRRAAAHGQAALRQFAVHPRWGAVTVPAGRTDIYGGTMTGWGSFLTVHGASWLATRPLLVIDLTGQYPATGLLGYAGQAGINPTLWRLPADLSRSGILQGLTPDELASAIAEAIHAGAAGGARSERAADAMVLRQLAQVIAPAGVTMPRLAAAITAALGYEAGQLLSEAEQGTISGTLFPPGGARDQASPSLNRLDSVIRDLAKKWNPGWPADRSACVCVCLDAAPDSAEREVLGALLIQWITAQAAKAGPEFPSVIVAGADDITGTHLERLADACEVRGVSLTLMFRHLRDDAATMLGGARTTAFMRLNNHAEAEQAANYIGRDHVFRVSGRSLTKGTSSTTTVGTGTSRSTSDSTSRGTNQGWAGGDLLGFGATASGGKSRSRSTSTSQGTSESRSSADGTNESATENTQRSYDFRVEPTRLQNLGDSTLLLIHRVGDEEVIDRAVDCDPGLIPEQGATAAPLPPPAAIAAGAPPVIPAVPNHAEHPEHPALPHAHGSAPALNPPDSTGADSAVNGTAWPRDKADAPDLSWPHARPDGGNPLWRP